MAITRGLCSLEDVKAALRITDTVDDTILELNIEAASREIENHCERQFTSGTATRVYVPQDAYTTQIDDLVTLTTLKTSSTGETFDTTWAAGDYQLEPLNGLAGGLETPFTRIRAIGDYLFPIWDPTSVNAIEATVQVTGTFGFSSVPTAVRQACVLYSSRLFKRNDSPLGSYGMGDIGIIHVRRIDPDIEALLAPFRKVRMA